jgi:phage terminase large subunit-like protein
MIRSLLLVTALCASSMTADASLMERLSRDPAKMAAFVGSLTEKEAAELEYLWPAWARPKQLAPPGDWRTWLVLAGRGFGKTRTGGEFVRDEVDAGRARFIGIAGPTADDIRDAMIEGESGLLSLYPARERPKYEPSKRRITFANGVRALLIAAAEPDRFRGKQYDLVWADELAAWRYRDAWDQIQFGLRLGTSPRAVVTTTPRPTPLIRELVADPTTVVTRGSTYENKGNLAKPFLAQIVKKYEGTRLGRQELDAEILDDNPGALWNRGMFDAKRLRVLPALLRTVVAVDPSVDAQGAADECGIVVGGVGMCSCLGKPELHGFIFEDVSAQLSPNAWAQRVDGAFKRHEADRVVAEVNNGGALVEVNIRTANPRISYRAVHASKGKRTRAEPVAALYEQGKVHHVGSLPKLEDEMATWDPLVDTKSPNRMDALVWALTDLMLEGSIPQHIKRPAGLGRMFI